MGQRQSAITVTHNFTKGLVTTASALAFPENACTDVNNCTFTLSETVDRRPGIDIESSAVLQTITSPLSPDEGAYTEFLWTNVGGIGNKSWIVVQQYQTLYFYDVSTSTQVGQNLMQSLSFTSFIGTGINDDPGLYPCQFAQGNGYLFITNPCCDPFYITYTQSTNSVAATVITVQTRDLLGLPEIQFPTGVNPITYRAIISNSLATLNSTYPNHYYNLYNQGWGLTNALALWVAARTDCPANSDYTALYRSSPTTAFSNTYVGPTAPGNNSAAKGHYILTEFCPNRSGALVAEGFTSIGSGSSTGTYPSTAGTGISNINMATTSKLGTAPNIAFDFNLPETVSFWFGYEYTNPATVSSVTFVIDAGIQRAGIFIPTWNVSATLYGSNTAPNAAGNNGTALGEVTLKQGGTITIPSSITTTAYKYIWVSASGSAAGNSNYSAAFIELSRYQVNYTVVGSGTPVFTRPSTVAWYAGRVWYAGQQTLGMSSNLYFSQIILNSGATGLGPTEAGYCYQANDPTCEQVSDLLPSDGGVIQIQDMGAVKKLYPFKSGLLVFASNGLWLIEGAGGQGFQANNYIVRKLSAVGCIAPFSVVSYKGTPLWWAEDGIYTVNYNPNYDSYDPQPISYQVINQFFKDIPTASLQFVKSTYNTIDQTVYWLYNDNENLPSTDYYKYNRVLLLNGWTDAFYPWEFARPPQNSTTLNYSINIPTQFASPFSIPNIIPLTDPVQATWTLKIPYTDEDIEPWLTPDPTGPFVRGALYFQDGARMLPPVVKYITTNNLSNGFNLFFSDTTGGSYFDWTVASGTPVNYNSYFTTGYKLDAETQRFFQPGYCFVFFKAIENAQCQVQAFYDFALDPNTNKFSSAQYAYPVYINSVNNYDPSFMRAVNYRKMKIRGKGRALQLNFSSVGGQPFSIYGWSLDETASPKV